MQTSLLRVPLCLALLLGLLLCPLALRAEEGTSKGFRFPSFQVPSLQLSSKKATQKMFNFADVIGKQAIVLLYFMPGHEASETELKALAAASVLLKGTLVMGMTKASKKEEIQKAKAFVEKNGIALPILLDEKGLLAYVTLTRHVPSYAGITKSGYLRLSNASALTETIGPHQTTLRYLKSLAAHEDVPFLRAPGYSPNPYDLIGKKAPPFKSSHLHAGTGEIAIPEGLSKEKPTLLVFWASGCPHCQKTLPPLDKYAKEKKAKFDLLTLVNADDEGRRKALKEFVDSTSLGCKILSDDKGKVSDMYLIMMVPTMFFVDTQGVIRFVYSGGGEKIGDTLERLMAPFLSPARVRPTSAPAP